MFERDLYNRLNTRLSENNFQSILLEGVRGCGKTTLAGMFSKRFAQSMTFTLSESHDRQAFEEPLKGKLHFSDLYRLRNRDPNGGRTLLFIDDIHAAPWIWDTLNALPGRPPNLFLLGASSRMPNAEYRIPKAITLHPLSFPEFLSATGETEALSQYLEVPCPDHPHARLLGLFHRYVVVGGMPEAVSAWTEEHTMTGVDRAFGHIVSEWNRLIGEQVKGVKSAKLASALLADAFPFAADRIRFTGFANRPLRSREAAQAFRTLEKLLFVSLIHPVTETIPESLPDTGRSPRLQFADTGMVVSLSGIRHPVSGSADLSRLVGGQVLRHAAGQEIISSYESRSALFTEKLQNIQHPASCILHPASFWVRDKNQSQAEVDFVIPFNDLLIPVSVRPGEPGRLRSLHRFMDEAPHPFAVRLSAGRLSVRKTATIAGKPFYLMSLPYYLAGRIPEHLEGFVKYVGG